MPPFPFFASFPETALEHRDHVAMLANTVPNSTKVDTDRTNPSGQAAADPQLMSRMHWLPKSKKKLSDQ